MMDFLSLSLFLPPSLTLSLFPHHPQKRISERNLIICHTVNIASLVIFPVVVVFVTALGPGKWSHDSPTESHDVITSHMTLYCISAVGSFFSLLWYTVLFMKLVSYTQVNWWCRTDKSTKKKGTTIMLMCCSI